jgi:transmembrane sensor
VLPTIFMERTEYIVLLHKRLMGRLTEEEAQRLNRWEKSSEDNQKEAQVIETIWEKTPDRSTSVQPDVSAAWSQFQKRINEEPQIAPSRNGRRVWMKRLAAAASVLMVLALSWALWPDSDDNAWVALETQEQPEHEIHLPDGSVVWVNAHSSLAYSFEEGEDRQVKLQGEAFFQVAKNTDRPFRIQTSEGVVTVLGTSFNVRAYPGEGFEEVTVEEGKVSFKPNALAEKVVLGARQKATFLLTDQSLVADWDKDELAMAWKTGVFRFRGMPLKEVLDWSERHFNVSIDHSSIQPLLVCPYTTVWEDTEAEEALRALALAFEMQLEQTGPQSYRLTEGSCR